MPGNLAMPTTNMPHDKDCDGCRGEALERETKRLTDALKRIANEEDPLLGIGSELEFAQQVLDENARLKARLEPLETHREHYRQDEIAAIKKRWDASLGGPK
jgi:hypothetical protein